MPFTTEQLQYGAKASLDYFLKNDPIDQINTAHPLLKKLLAGKKEYGGGLQYVVEQLRFSNDSNFQTYFGDQQVTYNRKRTLNQAKFAWGNTHDGFGLDEDELAQNGIIMTDDRNAKSTDAERIQLNNLLDENYAALKLGNNNGLDVMLHRSGAASLTDVPGLDHLIQTDPTASSVVGTLNQNTYAWWRNNYSLSIAQNALVDKMELEWRNCTKYGGFAPDFILCGGAFLDDYRTAAGINVNREITADGNQKGGVSVDAGTTKVYFKGVELVWDPVMDDLDALEPSASPDWTKRCYFINTKFLQLRPIRGHWMVNRTPPRVYDRYVHYFGLTCKLALTTSKRNAHAVLAID